MWNGTWQIVNTIHLCSMYQAVRLGTHVKNRAINYFIQMNISKWMTILKGGEHWIIGFFLLLTSRRHFKFTPSEGIFRDRPLSFSQLVYSPSCFKFLMHIWSMAMINQVVFDFPHSPNGWDMTVLLSAIRNRNRARKSHICHDTQWRLFPIGLIFI